MVQVITRMAASSITRVTGMHYYAQVLPVDWMSVYGGNDIGLPIARKKRNRRVNPIWMAAVNFRGCVHPTLEGNSKRAKAPM